MSAVAEGEAAEAAFVSENTVSNVSMLRSATERLSESISETALQIRQTADIVSASTNVAQTAFTRVEHLAESANSITAITEVVDGLTTQINAMATLKIAGDENQNEAQDALGDAVSDIKALASQLSKAKEQVSAHIATVCGATHETVGSVQQISQKLALVLQQTRSIAVAMERQDIVTREIAGSMSAAANGTLNVSSSVERLKATIEEARGASMKVVTKATDMADEAHRLDSTVKSFLREVTA
jgi:methyl-accepting chemotaxis protein